MNVCDVERMAFADFHPEAEDKLERRGGLFFFVGNCVTDGSSGFGGRGGGFG